MSKQTHADHHDPMPGRRAAARRTALVVAGIALAVYVGFIVLNVAAQ